MWPFVQKKNPVWYLDATGGVIQKLKNQPQALLYSLVFHDKQKKIIFSLAEFLTTAHDSHSISGYLSTIKLDINQVLPKRLSFQVAPIIVTDFTWALINAVMKVFNNFTTDVYINWCFDIVFVNKRSFMVI